MDAIREFGQLLREWLWHKFTVHCYECETKCRNCERLYMLIEAERNEKRKLLDKLLEENILIRDNDPEINIEDIEPVVPRVTSWGGTRDRLERQSRELAAKKKENN